MVRYQKKKYLCKFEKSKYIIPVNEEKSYESISVCNLKRKIENDTINNNPLVPLHLPSRQEYESMLKIENPSKKLFWEDPNAARVLKFLANKSLSIIANKESKNQRIRNNKEVRKLKQHGYDVSDAFHAAKDHLDKLKVIRKDTGRYASVIGLLLILLSSTSLLMFSTFFKTIQKPEFNPWKIGPILKMIFPFTKTFDYNLTHVLLFSIIICLLSVGPTKFARVQEEKQE